MVEPTEIMDSFWYLATPALAEVGLSVQADKTPEHRSDKTSGRSLGGHIDQRWF
jgi:hypothetical protein